MVGAQTHPEGGQAKPAGGHFLEHAHPSQKAQEPEQGRRVGGGRLRQLVEVFWAVGQAIRNAQLGHHVQRLGYTVALNQLEEGLELRRRPGLAVIPPAGG